MNFLSRTQQIIEKKLSTFRKIEVYFTFQDHLQGETFSLYLSHLPPFQTLLKELPQERFLDKTFIFFFGKNCHLNPTFFLEHKIPLEKIEYANASLYILQVNPKTLSQLSQLDLNYRDWWCLTQNQKPVVGDLEKKGIVAGPAAFSVRHPQLNREVLINYFIDPSFHGFEKTDFRYLIHKIFQNGFLRLFPHHPSDYPPFKNFDPFERLQLKSMENLTDPSQSPQMRNFILSGGETPSIVKVEWPGGKRLRTLWSEGNWGKLMTMPQVRWRAILDLSIKYLIPILLIPVAIIVVPLTLAIWLTMAIYGWLKQVDEVDKA